jgi:hypothetical protein
LAVLTVLRIFDHLFHSRKIDLESRALPYLAIDPDVSFALLDDAIDCRKSQARPFAVLLGGEERLEDAGGRPIIVIGAVRTESGI